jgi:type IV pilus assembly protein PilM
MGFLSNVLTKLGTPASTAGSRTVGVDIGASSIKLVELEEREGVLTLMTYGAIELGPYAGKEVGEAVALTPEQEQLALVDSIRESAVKAKSAVMAMPLSASFVTVMSLPSSPDEDLSPRIRIEARKYIPAQINEVTLDWAEIASSDAEAKNRDVLVAAIQNDALSRLNALMEFVGFKAPPSEIECFSAIRALARSVPHAVIIDVGATVVKLYIVRDGLLQRMHRARGGGAVATRRIADVLEIPFTEAELRKRSWSDADPAARDIVKAHHSTYDRVFSEFRQVIESYERSLGVTVPVVYLTGGGALFGGIVGQATDVLGREVVMARPFDAVAYPAFMEDLLVTIGPVFSVALGAAVRAYE